MKVDNSQVVREVDPRSFRDLLSLLVLVAVLVVGLVLYAWPHLELRQTGMATERMNREKERLIEQNRKLRLEKAALENLRRVEQLATRELGLTAPAPEQSVVVEVEKPKAAGTSVARREARGSAPAEARP